VAVFEGLSLIANAGKTLALVGGSGSGKSTVVALLLRWYAPATGGVFLDDVDIRSLDLRWLRGNMGLVAQEPALFNTTIRENIAFGRDGPATEEEIEAAARAANAHDFIAALPLGYDTPVGERGTQLSGGQKQRVAIARAVLRNPRILLLDEATSALDTRSEALVQEALSKLMAGRTAIVIAHRLSSVVGADKIAVMDGGRVVEEGNHRRLLGKGGAYAALFRMQLS